MNTTLNTDFTPRRCEQLQFENIVSTMSSPADLSRLMSDLIDGVSSAPMLLSAFQDSALQDELAQLQVFPHGCI